jgi:hypothetical protein
VYGCVVRDGGVAHDGCAHEEMAEVARKSGTTRRWMAAQRGMAAPRMMEAHTGRWPRRRGRVARRGVGWGHARGDGRSGYVYWDERMATWCDEARDGRAEWGDVF